jgi:hypothetical protein
MAKQATTHDGLLMLQLYDLRREAEMRKARSWFLLDFWPLSPDDFLKIANDLGSQENNWLRQVGGYWDMASSLVLQGALHEELFLQPGCSGEMFFLFAKVQPFLKELRQKMGNPDVWGNIEQVATGSKLARKRLERVSANVEKRRAAMVKAKK